MVRPRMNTTAMMVCLLLSMVSLIACGDDGDLSVPDSAPDTMMSTETIAPGETCEFGGTRFQIGSDDNGDGEIDTVEDEAVVCDGVEGHDGAPGPEGPAGDDGADGLTPEVEQQSLPSHDECPSTATEVVIGFDTDGEGDIDEVSSTFVICDGEAGETGPQGEQGEPGTDHQCIDAEDVVIVDWTIEDDPFGVYEVGLSYELRFELQDERDLDELAIDIIAPFGGEADFELDAGAGATYTAQWTPDESAVGKSAVMLLVTDGCSMSTDVFHIDVEEQMPRLELSYDRFQDSEDSPDGAGQTHDVEVCLETRNISTCHASFVDGDETTFASGSGCESVSAVSTDGTPNSVGEQTSFAVECHGTTELPGFVDTGFANVVHYGPGLVFDQYAPGELQMGERRYLLPEVGYPIEFSWSFHDMESCQLMFNDDATSVDDVVLGPDEKYNVEFGELHRELVTETATVKLACEDDGGTNWESPQEFFYIVDWGISFAELTPLGTNNNDNFELRADWHERGGLDTCTVTLFSAGDHQLGQETTSTGDGAMSHTFTLNRVTLENFEEDEEYRAEFACSGGGNSDEWTELISVGEILESEEDS